MQKLFIAGGVGKDAQLRTTQGGDQVLSFSLAIDNGKDRDGNKRDSTWYDCSLFGKRAEALAPHIKKGDRLTLIGRPTVRVHEGKAYLGISVDDLTFMGSAARPIPGNEQSGGTAAEYRDKQAPNGSGRSGGYGDDMDDDIPFEKSWR
jgi:single-strand DNA-binding protein